MNKIDGSIPGLPDGERKARDAAKGKEAKRTLDAVKETHGENLRKLEAKLDEYKARFASAESRLAYAAPEIKDHDIEYLDAAYKMITAEEYLKNTGADEINDAAIVAEIRKRGLPLKKEILFNALGVIESYVTEGGATNTGGTGFGESGTPRAESAAKAEVAPQAPESPAEDAEDRAEAEREKAIREAEAGWQERVEEWEAKNRAAVAEVVNAATTEAAAAEKKAAEKIASNTEKVSETLGDLAESFLASEPVPTTEEPSHSSEGTSFAQDLSDSIAGTSFTDRVKGWIFGRDNVRARTSPTDQHRGVREIPAVVAATAREYPANFLRQVVDLPRDISRRLDEWSPNAQHEREQLAEGIETTAKATRDRLLSEMSKEADAIYRQGLSAENQAKLNELRDRADNVETDYQNEVARSGEMRGGTIEKGAKLFAWTGITVSLDALSFLGGFGHIVKEMGQSFADGVRGERRSRWAERTNNAPYSHEAGSLNAPQERAIGAMERLGDWLMTKAIKLEGEREEFADTVREEVNTARQKEAAVFQDVISKRIETLTEKTKLTKTDQVEIGKLLTKLSLARQGLVGAKELGDLIERAGALGKKDEARKDDENLLMGYLSGRAINTVKTLDVLPPEARNALITELQNNPSREALQAAEMLIYASLDENVQAAGITEINPEQREQLESAHVVLKDSLARATDVYQRNLATISADIVKGLQAANRDLKKAAAEAASSREEQAAA